MKIANAVSWRFAALLALGIAGSVVADPTPAGEQELLRRLDTLRESQHISALGLAIVDLRTDGSALNFTTGLGTLAHGSEEPVDQDTIFRLGSVTKGFTALTFLRLQQKGMVNLDAPLHHYLDKSLWLNAWQAKRPLTAAQLLEHTAGFTDMSQAEWDSAEPLPLERALARFASVRVVQWPPGEWRSYSNIGAGLVGRAMEVAAGQAFETLVTTELLQPLGMRNSGFDPSQVRVTGYDRDGLTPIVYWHTVYRPFGGLNASVADMARYLRLHLERGLAEGQTFLDAGIMRRVEQPTTSAAAHAGLDFGYGLGNYSWLRDGVLFQGHGGDADGYLSRLGYSHELGRGYFLVINAFNSSTLGEMRAEVERFLSAGFKPRPAPPKVPLTTADHGWLEGRFAVQTRRFGWRSQPAELRKIEISDEALRYRAGKGWVELLAVAVSADTILLRRRQENRATAIAFRTPQGEIRLVDGETNLQKLDGRQSDQEPGPGQLPAPN